MPDIEAFRRLVGEDPAFQRRVWVAQRAGWAAMAALVLLALAGGLGGGPLSATVAESPDGALRIGHEAVTRQDSITRWDIALPAAGGGLTIRSDALAWFDLAGIEPAPEGAFRAPGSLALRLPPGGLVTLRLQPRRPGLARVEVAAGASVATFRMLVLP